MPICGARSLCSRKKLLVTTATECGRGCATIMREAEEDWGRVTDLLLKRAATSRPSGKWNDDDYDVLADGAVVGRIMKAALLDVSLQKLGLPLRTHSGRRGQH